MSVFPEVFKQLTYSSSFWCCFSLGGEDVLALWMFWVGLVQQVEGGKALQLLALCPLRRHQRQSPSLKQQACSMGVSFVIVEFCDGDHVNIHCIGVFLEVESKG